MTFKDMNENVAAEKQFKAALENNDTAAYKTDLGGMILLELGNLEQQRRNWSQAMGYYSEALKTWRENGYNSQAI
ncbi:MAG: hypothetical protein IPM82_32335 [Saprospiraceae bacterium]|nr:hypothetical protein [Saprospiraceae bacterium]